MQIINGRDKAHKIKCGLLCNGSNKYQEIERAFQFYPDEAETDLNINSIDNDFIFRGKAQYDKDKDP